jgi:hypothetical protein
VKLKIKSQLPHEEKGGILDDCGPSSAACAVAWATGYKIDPSAADGIKAKAAATGFTEKQGVSDNGSSLQDLAATARQLGARASYPKAWIEVTAAAMRGSAIIINVQAPIGYPKQAMSAWQKRYAIKNPTATYGHMVCAAWHEDTGWQFADPTFSGKGKEQYAALITLDDLRRIAESKGDKASSRCLIVSEKEK